PTNPDSGGSGNSGGPARAALGYTFTPDAGQRIATAAEPNVLVTPTETLLYTACCMTSLMTSADGLTFTALTSQMPGGTRAQSFIRLADGSYRMYFLRLPGGADLLSATSPDGVNWTQEAGTRVALNTISVPFVAPVPGGYRVYYVTSGGPTSIASA